MTDLVAFLRARLDEDERRLKMAWFDPGRRRREVDAKRRIMDEHTPRVEDAPPFIYLSYCPVCCDTKDSYENPYREESPCRTLRLLVMPYSDHPDYDPAWAPA